MSHDVIGYTYFVLFVLSIVAVVVCLCKKDRPTASAEPEPAATCQTCRFFSRDSYRDLTDSSKVYYRPSQGQCRRNPPSPSICPGWPFVAIGDLCGEYRRSETSDGR